MQTLYSIFQDLDRSAVSDGTRRERCEEVVAHKRRTVESTQFKNNPLVASVLAGQTSFVAIYDSFSREFRGVRRFIPKSHDPVWNERLDQLSQVIPNVRHFKRRSYLAFDNPLGTTIYGVIAGFGVAVVMSLGQSSGGEPGDAVGLVFGSMGKTLVYLMAGAGFIFGSIAMLKYRTRDYNQIHAREAAGYIDLNLALFRANNDSAWARMFETNASGHGAPLARPD